MKLAHYSKQELETFLKDIETDIENGISKTQACRSRGFAENGYHKIKHALKMIDVPKKRRTKNKIQLLEMTTEPTHKNIKPIEQNTTNNCALFIGSSTELKNIYIQLFTR